MASPGRKDARASRTSAPRREVSRVLRHGVLTQPRISVIVTSAGDRGVLVAALEEIIPQCRRAGAELIVVSTQWRGPIDSLRHSFSGVRFVAVSPDATGTQLRAAGMAEADGDIVVFTSDASPVDEYWIESAIPAGAMERARQVAPWPERVARWRTWLSQRAAAEVPSLPMYVPRDAAVGSD